MKWNLTISVEMSGKCYLVSYLICANIHSFVDMPLLLLFLLFLLFLLLLFLFFFSFSFSSNLTSEVLPFYDYIVNVDSWSHILQIIFIILNDTSATVSVFLLGNLPVAGSVQDEKYSKICRSTSISEIPTILMKTASIQVRNNI